MYLCAMDVTMSEAGVAAVCERVWAGHCGLQSEPVLKPLLISPRVRWRSAIVRGAIAYGWTAAPALNDLT